MQFLIVFWLLNFSFLLGSLALAHSRQVRAALTFPSCITAYPCGSHFPFSFQPSAFPLFFSTSQRLNCSPSQLLLRMLGTWRCFTSFRYDPSTFTRSLVTFLRGQSPLGGCQHLFEARIVADAIEIRIDFGMIDKAGAHLFERRAEHFQSGVLVVEVISQRAAKIVAHGYVVRIDQQSALHPLLCSLALTQLRQRVSTVAHRRTVVRVAGQIFLAPLQRNFGSPLSSFLIAESRISRDQHPGGAKVSFVESQGFFPIGSGLLNPLLSESQKGCTSVGLVRFGVEPKSDFDFPRRFVIAVFLGQNSGLYRIGVGEVWIEFECSFRSGQSAVATLSADPPT